MTPILETLLSNTIIAAIMALMIAMVAVFMRRPAWVHALWLLVLLKLVTQPIWKIELPEWKSSNSTNIAKENVASDFSLQSEPAPPEQGPIHLPPIVEQNQNMGRPTPPIRRLKSATTKTSFEKPKLTRDEPKAVTSSAWAALPPPVPLQIGPPNPPMQPLGIHPSFIQLILIAFWLTGAAIWLLITLNRIRRFRSSITGAAVAPVELKARCKQLATKIGLSRCPTVKIVPGNVPPMLWAAFRRPLLLLPADLITKLNPNELATIIVHELAHLRRGDHWVRRLEALATALYWWNPILWLARRELREAEEHCCDAWVVQAMPDARKTYADALIQTVEFLSEPRPPQPSWASTIGHIHPLRRRLTMIMQAKTPKALSWTGCFVVLALSAAVLPFTPVMGQNSGGKEKPPKLDSVKQLPPKQAQEPASKRTLRPQMSGEILSVQTPSIEWQMAMDALKEEEELLKLKLQKSSTIQRALEELDVAKVMQEQSELLIRTNPGSVSKQEIGITNARVRLAAAKVQLAKSQDKENEIALKYVQKRIKLHEKMRESGRKAGSGNASSSEGLKRLEERVERLEKEMGELCESKRQNRKSRSSSRPVPQIINLPIKKGERAFAITVEADSFTASFAVPSDRVDIFSTIEDPNLILQDIEVLALEEFSNGSAKVILRLSVEQTIKLLKFNPRFFKFAIRPKGDNTLIEQPKGSGSSSVPPKNRIDSKLWF